LNNANMQIPPRVAMYRASVVESIPKHRMHWVPPVFVHIVLNTSDALSPQDAATKANIRYVSCQTAFVGDHFGLLDVKVALCRPRKRPTISNGDRGGGIAMCIPPLYNAARHFSKAGGVAPILEAHFRHHKSLGVEHTFVYSAEAPDATLLQHVHSLRSITVLHMDWVDQYRVHQRAQNWQINDCIHLVASRRFSWALNMDLDEFVVFPLTLPGAPPTVDPSMTRSWLLALATEARRQQQQVVTFGSRPSNVRPLEVAALLASSSTGATVERLPAPECNEAPSPSEGTGASNRLNLCVGWQGRRKHLSHASSVWTANIHTVSRCKPTWSGDEGSSEGNGHDRGGANESHWWYASKERSCRVLDLDANSASLLHVGQSGVGAPIATYSGMPGNE